MSACTGIGKPDFVKRTERRIIEICQDDDIVHEQQENSRRLLKYSQSLHQERRTCRPSQTLARLIAGLMPR